MDTIAKMRSEKVYYPSGRRRARRLRHYFSKFFDWNDSSLFKNFLQVDVYGGELNIHRFVATGCLEHEEKPPVEDRFLSNLRFKVSGDVRRTTVKGEKGSH